MLLYIQNCDFGKSRLGRIRKANGQPFGVSINASCSQKLLHFLIQSLKQLCVLLSVPADAILFGIESSNSEAERSAALQFLTDRLSHLPDADFWATKEILDKLLEVMARSR